jgi:hypothetical protein
MKEEHSGPEKEQRLLQREDRILVENTPIAEEEQPTRAG